MSFKPSSRRHFIISAGAALTAAQATHAIGANDRIRVGIVGLGGRGKDHMDLYFDVPGAEVVALCDIEQAALERAAAYVVGHGRPKAKEYADMRGVFDDPGVDAVSMPLPNHWHALATIWACQAGKGVYIQKPAPHNVFEGPPERAESRRSSRSCPTCAGFITPESLSPHYPQCQSTAHPGPGTSRSGACGRCPAGATSSHGNRARPQRSRPRRSLTGRGRRR